MTLFIVNPDKFLRFPTVGDFSKDPTDLEIEPTVSEFLKSLVLKGHTIALESNQGGIEAGYRSLENQIIAERYTLAGCPFIAASFFCPDFRGENLIFLNRTTRVNYDKLACPLAYRKPAPGSFMLIAQIFDVPISECVSVGIFPEDRSAAGFLDIPHFSSLQELQNGVD